MIKLQDETKARDWCSLFCLENERAEYMKGLIETVVRKYNNEVDMLRYVMTQTTDEQEIAFAIFLLGGHNGFFQGMKVGTAKTIKEITKTLRKNGIEMTAVNADDIPPEIREILEDREDDSGYIKVVGKQEMAAAVSESENRKAKKNDDDVDRAYI